MGLGNESLEHIGSYFPADSTNILPSPPPLSSVSATRLRSRLFHLQPPFHILSHLSTSFELPFYFSLHSLSLSVRHTYIHTYISALTSIRASRLSNIQMSHCQQINIHDSKGILHARLLLMVYGLSCRSLVHTSRTCDGRGAWVSSSETKTSALIVLIS